MSRRTLSERWLSLHGELEEQGVLLLAVSKYHSDEAVAELAELGQIDFGESRPQSLRDRSEKFPDLKWHMIGPLQKNKAKYVARHAAVWHSLCDIEVAAAVAKYVEGRRLPVLLQVNISGERQKQGVDPRDVDGLLKQVKEIPQFEVIGLMGMAAKSDGSDDEAVRDSFRMLRNLRDQLGDASLRELCMGMSSDFRIAVAEGATIVRLGTVLFGPEDE